MAEKKYNLRLPGELYDALQNRADKNRRSMNNEIVIMLERYISAKEIILEGSALQESMRKVSTE